MKPRLAVVVSHPIQHFAPWHREIVRRDAVDLRVFFCCDWGVEEFVDPDFGTSFRWDVPLTEGYEYEFLPIRRRPLRLGFWEVDNPAIGGALDRFDPHVVQVLGWAYRTNWRALSWAQRRRRPVLLYTDSHIGARPRGVSTLVRESIVRYFYRRVSGALYVGDNNRAYHRFYGIPEERLFPGVYPIDRARLVGSVPDRAAARSAVRERHGIPRDAFVALACGKLIARKRALDVAAAVADLAEQGRPIWALLVGEGRERGEIEAFLAQRGVTNVVITGFVNQMQIAEYFAASDVLVAAADYDAHPLVVSEAACFGLPILASDAIGCIGENDTAKPGRNAIVFPRGDRERLRDGIATLAGDSETYGRMSKASLEVSEWQDASVAAEAVARATCALQEMGPR